MFGHFSECISHLSLVIILKQISVFIHLELATGRSSTKRLFQLKYVVIVKFAGCRPVTLLKLNFFTEGVL